jgi:hypothetical protein
MVSPDIPTTALFVAAIGCIVGWMTVQNELGSSGAQQPGCQVHSNRDVKVLIGIVSGPANFEQRALLRQTWLSTIGSDKDVAYRFLIGQSDKHSEQLDQEIARHCGDVVELAVVDTYRNLPAWLRAPFLTTYVLRQITGVFFRQP